MQLSVVIPVYNEHENIPPLMEALRSALNGIDYEIVFVDDGSSDTTIARINELADDRVRVIAFSRNYGQTSAMAAGIAHAEGEYIATMDGDLQNDPSDIPMMMDKLKTEELDIVVGRRLKRQDGMFLRKIPSKVANFIIRKSTGVYVSDYGCTLKVFNQKVAKNLGLYGELHRFIPVLSNLQGAKMAEVDVKHHPRRFGTSKYGLGRILRVMSDLMLMLFLQKYRQKPMHLFGGIGIVLLLLGGLIESYLLLLKLFGEDIGHRPLFYVGILFLITGVQFITTGFIAELMMRIYFESQAKTPYHIARRYVGGRELDS